MIPKRLAPRRAIERPAFMPTNVTVEAAICHRKRKFDTRNQAKQFARQVKREHGRAQRAYHCPVCGRFHLTTVDT